MNVPQVPAGEQFVAMRAGQDLLLMATLTQQLTDARAYIAVLEKNQKKPKKDTHKA
jgi:hypothetical protein